MSGINYEEVAKRYLMKRFPYNAVELDIEALAVELEDAYREGAESTSTRQPRGQCPRCLRLNPELGHYYNGVLCNGC